MEIVPVHAGFGAVGTLGTLFTVYYYMFGFAVLQQASEKVPEVLDFVKEVAETGAVELADWTVMCAKLLIVCIALNLLYILVWVSSGIRGMFGGMFSWFFPSCCCVRRQDSFLMRYGGRLRGGMKRMSVAELKGEPRIGPGITPRKDPVPLNDLALGEEFSFVYWRGSRAGKSRRVKLLKVKEDGVMECLDLELQETRKYWPLHTSDFTREVEIEIVTEGTVGQCRTEGVRPGSAEAILNAESNVVGGLESVSGAKPPKRSFTASLRRSLSFDALKAFYERGKGPSEETTRSLSSAGTPDKQDLRDILDELKRDRDDLSPADREAYEEWVWNQNPTERLAASDGGERGSAAASSGQGAPNLKITELGARLLASKGHPVDWTSLRKRKPRAALNTPAVVRTDDGAEFERALAGNSVSPTTRAVKKNTSGRVKSEGELPVKEPLTEALAVRKNTVPEKYRWDPRQTGTLDEATYRTSVSSAAVNAGMKAKGKGKSKDEAQTLAMDAANWQRAVLAAREIQLKSLGGSVDSFIDREIRAPLTQDLLGASKSIWLTQYQIDDANISGIFLAKLRESLDLRMLLDRKNFYESSCVGQAAVVADLYKHGAKIRVIKPPGGGFVCMHVKNVLIDQAVYYTGSVNLTYNGLENNVEEVVRIVSLPTLAKVINSYESRWADAEHVSQEMIDKTLQNRQNRLNRKNSKEDQTESSSGPQRTES